MEINNYISKTEYRLKWKDLGYDNLLLMALLAMLAISILIWLVRGVK